MINYMHRVITNPADMNGAGSAVTVTTAGTVVQTLTAFRPMRIVRYGVIITTAVTGSNPFQLVGSFYPGPLATGTVVTGTTTTVQNASGYNSSNTPPFYYDLAGGTSTIAAASFSSLTAGAIVYHNVNPQAPQTAASGNTYYPAPDAAFIPPGGVSTQLWLAPGNSFKVTQANTLTAGAVISFIEVEEQGWVADYNNNQLLPVGFAGLSGILPTPSDPAQVAILNAQA